MSSESGHVGARVLAKTIAAYTVKVLLEGEMLDPASASDELLNYGIGLEQGTQPRPRHPAFSFSR